ncbi:MAG: hypothetical protein J0I20_00135 [Chloroflexi bacterium]|nr:hypothetical protein [Chloroflexota bacterium]OJW03223.1 MAG: hypothetical protein BGO39_08750 [Chloroflexi bacterium 54-19]
MNGEEIYHWFEDQLKEQIPGLDQKLVLTFEPTVTPGVFLGRVATTQAPNRAIIKSDIRPEGVRLHFPVDWGDELSEWLGIPPADAYRLKSNWVNQPSIGVGDSDFDPYFKDLTAETIKLLKSRLSL